MAVFGNSALDLALDLTLTLTLTLILILDQRSARVSLRTHARRDRAFPSAARCVGCFATVPCACEPGERRAEAIGRDSERIARGSGSGGSGTLRGPAGLSIVRRERTRVHASRNENECGRRCRVPMVRALARRA